MTDGDGFVTVCAVGDIPNGGQKAVEIGGVPILIINLNRHFHAVRNRCTHLDFPLEGGRLLGPEIICRKHGARFDICTGQALGGPAVLPVKVFRTRIIDGVVEVAPADGD